MKHTVTCILLLMLAVNFNGYFHKGLCHSVPGREIADSSLEHGGRVVRSPALFPVPKAGYAIDAEENKKKNGWFNRGKVLGAGGRFDVYSTNHKAKVVESYNSGKMSQYPDIQLGLYTRKRSVSMDDYNDNAIREERSAKELMFEDESDQDGQQRFARSPQQSPRIQYKVDRDNKAHGFSSKVGLHGFTGKLASKMATNVTQKKLRFSAPLNPPNYPNQVYPPYNPVQGYQPAVMPNYGLGGYPMRRSSIGRGEEPVIVLLPLPAKSGTSHPRSARSAQWATDPSDPHVHSQTDRDIQSNGFRLKAKLLGIGIGGRLGAQFGKNKTFTKFSSDSFNPNMWQATGYNAPPPWSPM